jgi:beta-glucosidase
MRLPLRSQLDKVQSDEFFIWATGIEDTFIADPYGEEERILDEYELTRHYELWEQDLELMASLGVKCARYGFPWYKINPKRGEWDWQWTDQVVDKLEALGIQPIVDLVHYGTPNWLDDGFLADEYPEAVAEFARRFAERYKGRLHWYTPLNEPRITAWYTYYLGWWPPYRKGTRNFLKAMVNIAKGIALTQKALLDVDPEIVCVHVDATDIFQTQDPELEERARHKQDIVFLALDLIAGLVDERHSLYNHLVKHGVRDNDLEWLRKNKTQIDICGINMYPMFSLKNLLKTKQGIRIQMPYAPASIVSQLSEMYWQRYKRPIMIAETASRGSIARRQAWMDDSIKEVARSRANGVPVVGYVWWPMFALISWGYRQGKNPLGSYLVQMGLWDLDVDTLERIETPLVVNYKNFAAKGQPPTSQRDKTEDP